VLVNNIQWWCCTWTVWWCWAQRVKLLWECLITTKYTVIHGQRVGNLSKIEFLCDSHVRTYKLYKDGHYPLHFHQDYKISVQVKLFLSMTSWKLRRFCPVTGQVINTYKRLIQLKTGNCKLEVMWCCVQRKYELLASYGAQNLELFILLCCLNLWIHYLLTLTCDKIECGIEFVGFYYNTRIQ